MGTFLYIHRHFLFIIVIIIIIIMNCVIACMPVVCETLLSGGDGVLLG
jgi:hypothetical protein